MQIYAETLSMVSVDLNGQHINGRYRVTGPSVIAYYGDLVKFVSCSKQVPAERLAQWLLTDMAIQSLQDDRSIQTQANLTEKTPARGRR
ncbi:MULTISPECIES: hypothetical protein [unclassified Caballeronia]|uniref:hypothetical protein n=1 Tax=unclassified Caballeronia TaxID=2646786 RepID=UPI00285C4B0E|nr:MULTISPECIES: hypothetical protein [unclassified Caballeronia]MDR5777083.1 hypothetical protein [Caballeronia sp. LZ002]MDR5798763.1 hypothetical protein [Caballeronia sp. LZ001]MDR5852583.1 hypothetical protein [Caballeronia sp. LZ003]